jgi:hypothetical protein
MRKDYLITLLLAIGAAGLARIVMGNPTEVWEYAAQATIYWIAMYPAARRSYWRGLSLKRYGLATLLAPISGALVGLVAPTVDAYLDAHKNDGWLNAIMLLLTLTVIVTGMLAYRRRDV